MPTMRRKWHRHARHLRLRADQPEDRLVQRVVRGMLTATFAGVVIYVGVSFARPGWLPAWARPDRLSAWAHLDDADKQPGGGDDADDKPKEAAPKAEANDGGFR